MSDSRESLWSGQAGKGVHICRVRFGFGFFIVTISEFYVPEVDSDDKIPPGPAGDRGEFGLLGRRALKQPITADFTAA
jgi:hypothetical protein